MSRRPIRGLGVGKERKVSFKVPVDVRATRPVDASDKGASPKVLERKLCGSGRGD